MKLEVSPVGSGSIKINGTIPNSYPATGVFYGRGIANLEAVPAPGYSFSEWSSDLSGTDNSVSLTLIHSSVITAHFAPIKHTISIQVEGNGSTEPAVGSHEYNEGDSVGVIVIPDDGWQFVGWSGDVDGAESAEMQLAVTSDKTVIAHFAPIVHTISIQVEGNGSTEPAVGSHEYNQGDSVGVIVIPDDGWQFVGWSGDVDGTEPAQLQVTVTSDKNITAHFSPVTHTSSIQVEGNGSTEPAVGSHEYNQGDSVSITAIPAEGWQFDGWSGDVVETALTTTMLIDSDKTITASFSQVLPEWWRVLRTVCGGILVMLIPPPRISETSGLQ